MTMNSPDGEIILCIAGGNTGHRFLEELAALQCRVVLLILDEHRDSGWPIDAVHQLHSMPAGMTLQQITNTVTYLARSRKFARIVALDRFNVEVAASLREHLRIPGMGMTTARYFNDRLAARIKASRLGLRVAAMTAVANYQELRSFMETVPAPWLLTPRGESWSSANRQLREAEQVWRALDELGDRQSEFFLEQEIEGDRFHVDSITADGTVLFSAVSPCRRAILSGPQDRQAQDRQAHDRQLLPALRAPCTEADMEALRRSNTTMLAGVKMARGVTHTEFLRSNVTRNFYVMETSASVDDSCIADMANDARGLNFWTEWARLEVASMRGERYELPAASGSRKLLSSSSQGNHRLA